MLITCLNDNQIKTLNLRSDARESVYLYRKFFNNFCFVFRRLEKRIQPFDRSFQEKTFEVGPDRGMRSKSEHDSENREKIIQLSSNVVSKWL